MPVVGPGFNFPTANSVADDFSLPQLANALGQGIGGVVIAVNLTGPDCGPNNAPTTCTIDTALSRQVVTAPFASTVSVPGPTIGQGVPSIASACIGLMWLARRRSARNPNSRPNVSGPQLAGLSRIHGLNDMADRSQIEAEFGILIHEESGFPKKEHTRCSNIGRVK